MVSEGNEATVHKNLCGLWRPILGLISPTNFLCFLDDIHWGEILLWAQMEFIGGSMSLAAFLQLLDCTPPTPKKRTNGFTLREVVSSVHTHPITKDCVDVGDLSPGDPFQVMGKTWWKKTG